MKARKVKIGSQFLVYSHKQPNVCTRTHPLKQALCAKLGGYLRSGLGRAKFREQNCCGQSHPSRISLALAQLTSFSEPDAARLPQ
eukprot:6474722-Amphidinium_carterae.1